MQDLSFENIDRLRPASIVTRLTNDVTVVTNFSASLMRIAVKVPITAVGAFVLLVIQAPRQLPVILVIVVVVGWLISPHHAAEPPALHAHAGKRWTGSTA